ncbi:MAG: hypothetical protein HZY76_13910 [Anaerolineae bacterium]|nr:MAG: hypothetical protein HZY76_13910 [Anaerolineae bacterium]
MTNSELYDSRALLVEDDPFMRQAVASFLTGLGFTVSPAATYTQAMTLLHDAANDFRLATLDVSLPECSEEDTARAPEASPSRATSNRPAHRPRSWSGRPTRTTCPTSWPWSRRATAGWPSYPKAAAPTPYAAVALALAGDVYLPANAIARSVPEAVTLLASPAPRRGARPSRLRRGSMC